MLDNKLYHYRATVLKVVDGDTVDLLIDLGLFVKIKRRVRLLGVDCPEKFGAKASEAGTRAREFTASLLPEGATVFVRTYLDEGDKYGRLLADVTTLAGKNASKELLAAGHASPAGKRG